MHSLIFCVSLHISHLSFITKTNTKPSCIHKTYTAPNANAEVTNFLINQLAHDLQGFFEAIQIHIYIRSFKLMALQERA
jgi:hypothetical protein